jgi:uncharacterized damage-inducible protein DinB
MSHDPRYPIGQFRYTRPLTDAERADCVERIATLPARIEAALRNLGTADWEKRYRPGGWNLRQLVNHLADSHLHAYTRFMFALAESGATIRPYDQARWADEIEQRRLPPELALAFLHALHARWVALLRTLTDDDFQRSIHHPEHGRALTVDELLGLYAWHGDHHLAHIRSIRERAA